MGTCSTCGHKECGNCLQCHNKTCSSCAPSYDTRGQCGKDVPIQKAPQRQQTPSGKVIDHCAECNKYGVIASNTSGRDLCKVCDVNHKASSAGFDAMRGDN